MRFPTIKYYFTPFVINHNLISIIQGVEVENNKQKDGKNGYPNGFEVDFFHHGFSSESGYIPSKVILFSSDTCKSKIFRIFVLSDQWLGSKMAPKNRGFFNPIQYGGGLVFVPETGDPDQGSDSGNGHRFYLVAVKNLVNMKYNSQRGEYPPLAISAEKIIDDLVTSDEISNLRTDLKEMLHYYLLQEDDSYFRRKVHASYLTLDMMLHKIEKLTQERRVV